jgi:DNA-binding LacI/PurR family transcriptional regulator
LNQAKPLVLDPESAKQLTSRQLGVRDRLRELFQEDGTCPYGLLPPERQLAELVGVSRPTVRSVLSHMEDSGEVLRGHGSRRLAESPDASGSRRAVVGIIDRVLLEDRQGQSYPSSSEGAIVTAARDAIGNSGNHMLFFGHTAWTDEAIADLVEQRLSALLIFRKAVGPEDGQRIIETMRSAGVPVVMYGYADGYAAVDSVSHDHEEGQYLVTKHLIEHCGCRRIARVWKAESMPEADAWVRHREAGFLRAISEAGLEVSEPIPMPRIPNDLEDAERFEFLRRLIAGYLADRFADSPGPDALACLSDGQAIAAAAACRLFGRSPGGDIQIAGYDNAFGGHDFEPFEPFVPAVTVDKNNGRLGRILGEMTVDCIESGIKESARHHLDPPSLVIPNFEHAINSRT